MPVSRSRIYSLIFAAAIITVLASCGGTQPIRVGFIGTLTGRQSGLGIEGKNGVTLAVEDINAAGGINGRMLDITYYDDLNDPETARKGVSQFVEEEFDAIIGPMTSSMALAIVDQVNAAGTVLVSPTVSTLRLSGMDDHFFRINAPLDQDARIIAAYARSEPTIENLAVIYDERNAGYSDDWADALAAEFEKLGGTIIAVQSFHSSDNKAFPALASAVNDMEPDGVVLIAGAVDTALLAQQLKKDAPSLPLFSSTWAKTDDVITHGGSAAEGMVFSEIFSPESTDQRYVEFRGRFIDRFGFEPNFPGAEGYESVLFLAEGFHLLAADKKLSNLKEALAEIRVLEGTQGQISFDKYGDASRQHRLLQIQNGRFVYID